MAGDSKTEKATPKKRRDERKKGHVAVSKDVVMVASLLGIFMMLKLLFPFMYKTLRNYMIKYISLAPAAETLSDYTTKAYMDTVIAVLKACFPILLAAVLLAVIATGVQTRFLFTKSNLAPKFDRLNPLQGIKNILSVKSLVELIKSLIKIIILILILYQIIKGDLRAVARTIDMELQDSAVYVLNAILEMIIKVSIVFLAIAGFDFFYQWWDFERQIRMSKQELKEEYKQTEGNPEIKGRIRNIQRERARSRMMQAVPTADVIVRNPTHYAVALRYNIEKDNAPVLVAKGQDELALRIVAVGEENGVYVLENKPLARGIYAGTQVGAEIPPEYYGMVAEILVYVYRMNNKIIE
ncbi:flagellar biosynthesis protein FlhB [Lacrimispora saccharolytica]|uniref:Flagellar biosynthetic protein FlhB n=1 Tax=Lacrimispora saccharolytica (strain ATCC 35040 / DSM 2544 / NRCC 2533 / WM1) TaxID=610130 RepID=D9RA03_LACSW|nr:flagellar biosynthesis protein FlhB [Lacrimispora saccharolytica]ADL05975.1 flagellar biosynthetic protein FlhB [[Clostridium] saccharolyticum WM1]QRV19896.1 flagellar biosynthesis protein FlhB [Lacrimispora saccharolytica]